MDMKTIDEERAEIAKAAMTLWTFELEALRDDALFGEIILDELKRRDALRPSLEQMSTLQLARMLDETEAAAVVTEILEHRKNFRHRREELAEQGVACIG